MDLIHARATGTFVVQLAVPADQLGAMTHPAPAPSQPEHAPRAHALPARGTTASPEEATDSISAGALESDELVTVAGLGMAGTTEVRLNWITTLAAAGGSDADAARQPAKAVRWEVVSCHAHTGALLAISSDRSHPAGQLGPPGRSGRERATESKAYRPPQALIDLVRARDGRCRFPGCTINARFCDLDHVTPWPLGPTRPANLICLCRRHHRIRQTVRWQVRIDPDATVTWTDPTGRVRSTLPVDFLQRGTDLEVLVSAPSRLCGSAPRDTPDVRWSAWEEELAHELRCTERHGGRKKADSRRACGPPPRCELDVASGVGLDAFILDPAFAALCPQGRKGGRAGTGDEPAF